MSHDPIGPPRKPASERGPTDRNQALRDALENVKLAILQAEPDIICDTLWMPTEVAPAETVVDYIDAALAMQEPAPFAACPDCITERGCVRESRCKWPGGVLPASEPAPASAEWVDDEHLHQFAVISANYSRPFMAGAYPTLERAVKAQGGSPEKWHIFRREPASASAPSCEDCPPVGYPTDKTRCDECPRKAGSAIAVQLAEWKDNHHDCDCEPHESCGCKELSRIIQELENAPASAPSEWVLVPRELVEAARAIIAENEGEPEAECHYCGDYEHRQNRCRSGGGHDFRETGARYYVLQQAEMDALRKAFAAPASAPSCCGEEDTRAFAHELMLKHCSCYAGALPSQTRMECDNVAETLRARAQPCRCGELRDAQQTMRDLTLLVTQEMKHMPAERRKAIGEYLNRKGLNLFLRAATAPRSGES